MQTKERFFVGLFPFFSYCSLFNSSFFSFTSIFCEGNSVGYDDVSLGTRADSLGIRKVYEILTIPEKCKQCIYVSKECPKLRLYFSGNVKIARSFLISKFESSCIYSYATNARTNVDKFHENSSELGQNIAY